MLLYQHEALFLVSIFFLLILLRHISSSLAAKNARLVFVGRELYLRTFAGEVALAIHRTVLPFTLLIIWY